MTTKAKTSGLDRKRSVVCIGTIWSVGVDGVRLRGSGGEGGSRELLGLPGRGQE